MNRAADQRVLAVLGGSTPFTAGLVEALHAAGGELPHGELRLHGRDEAALELVRSHALAWLRPLGWSVT